MPVFLLLFTYLADFRLCSTQNGPGFYVIVFTRTLLFYTNSNKLVEHVAKTHKMLGAMDLVK